MRRRMTGRRKSFEAITELLWFEVGRGQQNDEMRLAELIVGKPSSSSRNG